MLVFLVGYLDALGSALYFAGSTSYACVLVHNHRLLTLKAGYFLQFKNRDGAQVRANAVSVAFRSIYSNSDHFSHVTVRRGAGCNKFIV